MYERRKSVHYVKARIVGPGISAGTGVIPVPDPMDLGETPSLTCTLSNYYERIE